MKVLFLTNSDYANFQYNMVQALRSVGMDCDGFKLQLHRFGYDNQCQVITANKINDVARNYDVIIACHSFEVTIPGKIVIPFHTGTKYRMEHERLNKYFNAPFALIALPEFQTLCPNFKYLVGTVNVSRPKKEIGEKLIVSHYPSSSEVKGTKRILKCIDELQKVHDFEFRYSEHPCDYQSQLDRLNECDIYVEMLNESQNGKPYGSFGITALEAAALGKIVVTQNVNDNGLYNLTYGVNMLNTVKNEEGLIKTLDGLLNYKGDYIKGQQVLTKDWFELHHSWEATGNKLKSYLNGL